MPTSIIQVEGMTCASCERRIERTLRTLDGVSDVKASYSKGQVTITAKTIVTPQIAAALERIGYPIKTGKQLQNKQFLALLLGVIAVFFIIQSTIGFNLLPTPEAGTSYGFLFVIGLITSLHCLAMCGGINMSQTVRKAESPQSTTQTLMPSLLYNAGRVLSYTLIGGIVGAIGSVFSLSNTGKAVVSLIAGVFMLIMGLNRLDIVPWLTRLQPRLPKLFTKGMDGKGPFVVGLLNGFMPCGPLQAMQIYALGTGSFATGALSMLLFSLGTVPLMFGLGALSSLMSSKFTKHMMKVSAALVLVLGLVMLGRGLATAGIHVSLWQGDNATVSGNLQEITTVLTPNAYEPITVKVGVPVKWTIKAEAKDINGCNNEFYIPAYDLTVPLKAGDNVVTFTPDKVGSVGYSCWMGMIQSNIQVVS